MVSVCLCHMQVAVWLAKLSCQVRRLLGQAYSTLSPSSRRLYGQLTSIPIRATGMFSPQLLAAQNTAVPSIQKDSLYNNVVVSVFVR